MGSVIAGLFGKLGFDNLTLSESAGDRRDLRLRHVQADRLAKSARLPDIRVGADLEWG